MALRAVFAGTPEFAVPSLDALVDAGHDVTLVYTQPDRPAGRGRRPTPSPVKRRAQELGLVVRQPPRLKGEVDALRAAAPDVMVVVAYGLLLPPAVLAIPTFGCVNVHASLLPRWRGAAPIQRAIEAGDPRTGVTIMMMDAGLDTGDMVYQVDTPIGADDTAATLHERLARMGADALTKALTALELGQAKIQAQPSSGVSHARKIDAGEARIDWTRPAGEIERRVRAFDPWPVSYTCWRGARLRIWRASVLPCPGDEAAGTVVAVAADGIDVRCGTGCLRVLELQPQGRRRMTAAEFLNGHTLKTGECLGQAPVQGTAGVGGPRH